MRTLAVLLALVVVSAACGGDVAGDAAGRIDETRAAQAAIRAEAAELSERIERIEAEIEAARIESEASRTRQPHDAALSRIAAAQAAVDEANERIAAAQAVIEQAQALPDLTITVVFPPAANPVIQDIIGHTPAFTERTGIEVIYSEDLLRDLYLRHSLEPLSVHVVVFDNLDVVHGAADEVLYGLDIFAENDPDYSVDDIDPTLREANSFNDELYAAPFYVGSALAPTNLTDSSGSLRSWGFGIPAPGLFSAEPELRAAWEYISWATGPDSPVPNPARQSLDDFLDCPEPSTERGERGSVGC